jgi:hypothetical protein
MSFKQNIGTVDKAVRLGVALLIAILIVAGVVSGVLAWILGIFAVVFTVTSFIGFCPLYLPFGLSTLGTKK